MDPNRRRQIITGAMVVTYAALMFVLSSWHVSRLFNENWDVTEAYEKYIYDIPQFLVAMGWCYWHPSLAYRGLAPWIWWGHLIYATALWLPRAFWMYDLRKDGKPHQELRYVTPEGIKVYIPVYEPNTTYIAVLLLTFCLVGTAVYLLNGLRPIRPWSLPKRAFKLLFPLVVLIPISIAWDWFVLGYTVLFPQ